MEFESAVDLRTAVEKLDQREFKGQRVTCVADVSAPHVSACKASNADPVYRPNPTCRPVSEDARDLPASASRMVCPASLMIVAVPLLVPTARLAAIVKITVTEALVANTTMTAATGRHPAVVVLLPWRNMECLHEAVTTTHTDATTGHLRTRMPMAGRTIVPRGTSRRERVSTLLAILVVILPTRAKTTGAHRAGHLVTGKPLHSSPRSHVHSLTLSRCPSSVNDNLLVSTIRTSPMCQEPMMMIGMW